MATTLTSLLGTELVVNDQPKRARRTFTPFAGATGSTAMHLGYPGYTVNIRGVVRVYGATYAVARANALTALNNIAALQDYAAGDYTFGNVTYYNAVFHNFRVQPRGRKTYQYTTGGYMRVEFAIDLIGLST
ncbi:MAG: hypothetical protein U9R68_00995 [Planctomycetota bacterium]|nr:hypothetical protein [Planctomycetota bacterium]